MKASTIALPTTQINDFCQHWKVVELALFGSILRDDFHVNSDVDVLITFSSDAAWNLLDLVEMQRELERIFERDVDLIERTTIEQSHNWIRRQEILSTAQTIYVAG